MAQSSGNQPHTEGLFLKKSVLSDMQRVKAQGALVRSRFKDIDQMDVPSKFFFSLEKKNGQKSVIHSLFSKTGSLISDPIEIRKKEQMFFMKCFIVVSTGRIRLLSSVSLRNCQRSLKTLIQHSSEL